MRLHRLNAFSFFAAIALVGWLSFAFNSFRVIDPSTFENYQLGSQRLVVDGIIHARQQNSGSFVMGSYFDESLPLEQQYDLRPDTLDIRASAPPAGSQFVLYESQFGLQGHFWAWLVEHSNFEVSDLRVINAGILALVVAGLAYCALVSFGWFAALVVSAALIFSPTVNAFARDLYWVSWTWYLPVLVVAAASVSSTLSIGSSLLWLIPLSVAFLIKLLSGYEYASAIVLTSMIPLVLRMAKRGAGWWEVGSRCFVVGVASMAMFAVAVWLHAAQLSTHFAGNAFDQIALIASKRMSASVDANKIAASACASSVDSKDLGCEARLVDSLQKSSLNVLARYLSVPEILPWITRPNYEPDDRLKATLKSAMARFELSEISAALVSASPDDQRHYLARALNPLMFWMLVIAFVWKMLSDSQLRKIVLPAAFLAVLAPISWFVLAKGHSAVHVGLNVVLWYVPTVPFLLMALTINSSMRNSEARSCPAYKSKSAPLVAHAAR